MKIIITIAGEGERWGNYKDVEKWRVNVLGSPILSRTVGMCNRLGYVPEVLCRADKREIDHATLECISGMALATIATNDSPVDMGELNKIVLPMLRAVGDDLVILFGDVFWDAGSLEKVLKRRKTWKIIGRHGASEQTGKPWGEIFGMYIPKEEFGTVLDAIISLNSKDVEVEHGLWYLYRYMCGVPLGELSDVSFKEREHAIWIDDWTEDFDFPEDYDRFTQKLNKYLGYDNGSPKEEEASRETEAETS